MRQLRNLQDNANRWGWRRALAQFFIRGIERYLGIHIYIIRFRPIPAEPQYPKSNPKLTFRQIDASEWPEFSIDTALNVKNEFITSAIDRGDLAFGAFDAGKLVSYVWRSRSCAPDVGGIWIKVDRPYCYSYNSFTRQDYRGQRISPVVHLFSDNEMRQYGYRYRAGFVAIANYASLEMGKYMGSMSLGYAGYISIGRLFFPFRARSVKTIGFSFFRPDGSSVDNF